MVVGNSVAEKAKNPASPGRSGQRAKGNWVSARGLLCPCPSPPSGPAPKGPVTSCRDSTQLFSLKAWLHCPTVKLS